MKTKHLNMGAEVQTARIFFGINLISVKTFLGMNPIARIDFNCGILKLFILSLTCLALSACIKKIDPAPQDYKSYSNVDSNLTIDSTTWYSPSPGDWWSYQTKMEGEWVEGTEYRDSIVSVEKKGRQTYLKVITHKTDTPVTREWRIDPSGLVIQRIGSSDSWLFIAHTRPQIGSTVPDSLKAFLTDCGPVHADSCVVYQQYDPNVVSGDSLANWIGVFQAKKIGVYIRTTSEVGDYMRGYCIKGEEHVIE